MPAFFKGEIPLFSLESLKNNQNSPSAGNQTWGATGKSLMLMGIYLSICLSISSIYLSIYLSISLIYLSHPSIHPSIYPSIYLSICLSVQINTQYIRVYIYGNRSSFFLTNRRIVIWKNPFCLFQVSFHK